VTRRVVNCLCRFFNKCRTTWFWVRFDFSNDPSALISVYRYNGEIIIDEVIYQKGLLNSQLASMINSSGARNIIYADSAEPKKQS
jgi:phage terminase large subunit